MATLVVTLLKTLTARGQERPRDLIVLIAPPIALLLVVSSQTGLNDHFRYALPAFGFLFVFIGQLAATSHRVAKSGLAKLGAAGILVCLAWSIASSLAIYPHSLAYFNELAGGPIHGHQHLLSSSIEWGQDLLFLKKWADEHPHARPLKIACYAPIEPAAAGIRSAGAPPATLRELRAQRAESSNPPQVEWYAVGVNNLHRKDGSFAYLRALQPAAAVGYSIYVYEVRPARLMAGAGLTTDTPPVDSQ